MNSVQGINPTTPQLTFTAKKPNRKQIHEFIDKSNILAMDFLNKNRPVAEKREIAIRRSLANLKIKCPYVGNIVKRCEIIVEHIKGMLNIRNAEKNESFINKAVKDGMMDADQAGSILSPTKTKLK